MVFLCELDLYHLQTVFLARPCLIWIRLIYSIDYVFGIEPISHDSFAKKVHRSTSRRQISSTYTSHSVRLALFAGRECAPVTISKPSMSAP